MGKHTHSIYKNTTGLNWHKPGTDAHGYILPAAVSFLQGQNTPQCASILDAGCGGGNLIAKLYSNDYKNVYGFDVSQSGIEVCLKNFPFLRGQVSVHDGYNSKIPFDLSSFDIVFSIEVIEHLFSPDIYLKNVNNWLKDRGFLIMSAPYHGYLKNIAITLSGKFDNHFNPVFEGGHIKFFSEKTLSKLLLRNGFDILKFKGVGRVPYLWKSMVILAQKIKCL